tara:strand:+ start:2128 stop:2853 length:726 start_codon:yes stop_codon:yes gene_type:complete
MIFSSNKKVDVGWFVYDDFAHKSFDQDFIPINKNTFSCPAVGSLNNKLFEVLPLFDLDVSFGVDSNDEPYFKYSINTKKTPTTDNIHNLIKDRLSVRKDNFGHVVLQLSDTKILVSDNKDLIATVLQPQNNVIKANCTFVSGEFKIYGWLRPLNAAYVQIDKTKECKISFKADEGFYSVMFSDPINLKEIEPNDKILKYLNRTYGISLFQKQLSRVYPKILKKRPKKLLSYSYHFRPYRSL